MILRELFFKYKTNALCVKKKVAFSPGNAERFRKVPGEKISVPFRFQNGCPKNGRVHGTGHKIPTRPAAERMFSPKTSLSSCLGVRAPNI